MIKLCNNGLVREVETEAAAQRLEALGYCRESPPEGLPSDAALEQGEQILRKNLMNLTVEKLRGLCGEREIPVPDMAKKAEIIELIIAHDMPAAT